jgi:hypothetical protein
VWRGVHAIIHVLNNRTYGLTAGESATKMTVVVRISTVHAEKEQGVQSD